MQVFTKFQWLGFILLLASFLIVSCSEVEDGDGLPRPSGQSDAVQGNWRGAFPNPNNPFEFETLH